MVNPHPRVRERSRARGNRFDRCRRRAEWFAIIKRFGFKSPSVVQRAGARARRRARCSLF